MSNVRPLHPTEQPAERPATDKALRDIVDALDEQITFADGVICAFKGVARVTDTEDDIRGAIYVAEAHIDGLKALRELAANAAGIDRPSALKEARARVLVGTIMGAADELQAIHENEAES